MPHVFRHAACVQTCPNFQFLLSAVAVLACVCANGCVGSSTAAKADARHLQQDSSAMTGADEVAQPSSLLLAVGCMLSEKRKERVCVSPMTTAGKGLTVSVAKSATTGGPTAKLAMHLVGSGCKLTCTTAPSSFIWCSFETSQSSLHIRLIGTQTCRLGACKDTAEPHNQEGCGQGAGAQSASS